MGVLVDSHDVVNVWRIPLLFFVSGMVLFRHPEEAEELLLERAGRILLPFLFWKVVSGSGQHLHLAILLPLEPVVYLF